MKNTLLSFGHGYTAAALSRHLVPKGWTIFGTTRNADKFPALKASGITPLIWPDGNLDDALERATHILVSVAPSEGGDPVLAQFCKQIASRAPNLDWVGYLSTTGVYGDHAGGWVDETTPLTPETRRGKLRVFAESQWQAIPDLPLHIFRLAGIYGPGRGPFAKVRNGTARRIIKENQIFSRTHVDDIAQILAASIARPNPGAIYNVCDDEPAPPEDVITYAANLIGLSVPPEIPFESADLPEITRSFYAESKRVRNDRIKTELGVQLLYPDYKAGLLSLLDAEK